MEDFVQTITLGELEQLMNEEATPKTIDIPAAIKKCIKRLIGQDITNDTKLLVPHVEYFKKLNAILNNFSSEDLSNYLIYQKIIEYAMYSGSTIRNLKLQFDAQLSGAVDTSPR